jgi:hypothetical protein
MRALSATRLASDEVHTIVRSVTIRTFSKIRNVRIDYKSDVQSNGLRRLEEMGELAGIESRN